MTLCSRNARHTDAPALSDAEIERRLAERAVAEARASGPDIPHEVVRAELLAELEQLRRKIEALAQE